MTYYCFSIMCQLLCLLAFLLFPRITEMDYLGIIVRYYFQNRKMIIVLKDNSQFMSCHLCQLLNENKTYIEYFSRTNLSFNYLKYWKSIIWIFLILVNNYDRICLIIHILKTFDHYFERSFETFSYLSPP